MVLALLNHYGDRGFRTYLLVEEGQGEDYWVAESKRGPWVYPDLQTEQKEKKNIQHSSNIHVHKENKCCTR